MGKHFIAPPDYDEPDVIEGSEPDPKAFRKLVWATVLFYGAVFVGIFFLVR